MAPLFSSPANRLLHSSRPDASGRATVAGKGVLGGHAGSGRGKSSRGVGMKGAKRMR